VSLRAVRIATLRRVIAVLVIVLLDWAALGATIWLSPGISARHGWSVLVAAVVLGVLAAVVRPLLAVMLSRTGWIGVFAGWLLTQAVLVYVALTATPGVDVTGFWPVFWASWVYAALVSVGLWFVTAGDPSAVVDHLIRVNRRYRRAAPSIREPGIVMIQVDGLSAPLAQWAVRCGNLPTLGRWLRSGSHRLVEWHAQLPATTPASQAGILHGASAHVPAFRWYEKESGRLVVTNHPHDSAYVESRLSDGKGLLADGGVSVSNVFSGDAPTSLLTMSTIGGRRASDKPPRYVSAYLLDPFGLTHSLVLTIGEIVKELHQARRQRVRRIEPRVPRTASYVMLRGATNVLLRHLNLSVIAEHMMRGAPAIYCDFVDYDEISHHAGMARPEALAALDGIDAALAIVERLALAAPRPYHLVVLSDHGHSQGATFRQRYGIGLDGLVQRLTGTSEPSLVATHEDEQQGRARTLRAGLIGTKRPAKPSIPAPRPEIVVVASGNLGMVYVAREPGRVWMEDLDERYPHLLAGLRLHPGIGWVMVRSQLLGPVVLGRNGRHLLADGTVDGDDPLAPFGPYAADDLRRHDTLAHVGDIVVNSALDPHTDEVAAFEELVGCHGGLGGWQTRPVLVYPATFPHTGELIGADAVHRRLASWLSADRLVHSDDHRRDQGEADRGEPLRSAE
jgi:hypothetical protein